MGQKEFDEFTAQLEERNRVEKGLTRSLGVAVEKDPDEEARRGDLSRRTGIPADWIPEFKDDVARRSLMNSPVVRELPRTSPKTTEWLSGWNNAAIAHDDIETLAGIEGVVDMMGRGAPPIGIVGLGANPRSDLRSAHADFVHSTGLSRDVRMLRLAGDSAPLERQRLSWAPPGREIALRNGIHFMEVR